MKDIKELAATIKKAFYIAATGRPGPVVVDIPKDVTSHTAEFVYPEKVAMRSYNPVVKGHAGQIRKAIQALVNAKRPMVYTGGGVILGDAAPLLFADQRVRDDRGLRVEQVLSREHVEDDAREPEHAPAHNPLKSCRTG